MTRVFVALLVGLALSPAGSALAGNVPAPTTPFDLRGAPTYSAVCVHEETGDVIGVRVFVRAPGSRPRVVIQFAEGDLGAPMAARSWIKAGRLYFALSATSLNPAIAGEVRRASIRLTEPYDDVRTLWLRNDLHGFPVCR